jgi:hypothetical protein
VGEQVPAPPCQPLDLVRHADRERVDVVVRHPAHVAVGGFGGQIDRFGVHRGGHPGDLDGLPRRLGRGVRGEVYGRGEAPGPVDDHPDGQASVVGQADLLAPDAFGAEVGVLGAEAAGLGEGRVRQFPQRQGGEFLVYPRCVIHAA